MHTSVILFARDETEWQKLHESASLQRCCTNYIRTYNFYDIATEVCTIWFKRNTQQTQQKKTSYMELPPVLL